MVDGALRRSPGLAAFVAAAVAALLLRPDAVQGASAVQVGQTVRITAEGPFKDQQGVVVNLDASGNPALRFSSGAIGVFFPHDVEILSTAPVDTESTLAVSTTPVASTTDAGTHTLANTASSSPAVPTSPSLPTAPAALPVVAATIPAAPAAAATAETVAHVANATLTAVEKAAAADGAALAQHASEEQSEEHGGTHASASSASSSHHVASDADQALFRHVGAASSSSDAHASSDHGARGSGGGHDAHGSTGGHDAHGSSSHGSHGCGRLGHGHPDDSRHGSHSGSSHANPSAHGCTQFHEYHATAEGRTVGYMLIGCVSFVMAMYYAVNWFQKKPRVFAWKMISATMSIFLAVLTFSVLEKTIIWMMSNVFSEEVLKMSLFVVLYGIMQFFLYKLKDKPLSLNAIGTISGHMCGFSAISAFDGIQHYVTTEGKMAVALFCFVVLMLVAFSLGAHLRSYKEHQLEEGHRYDTNTLEEWLEVCIEAEDDSMTLAFGLLISQMIRYMILGYLPPITGYPPDKTEWEINSLLACAFVCLAFLLGTTYAVKKVIKAYTFTFVPQARMARTVQGTTAMTATWIFIFWSQWQYYAMLHHDKMVMKTILAVVISGAVFPLLSIFSLRCVAATGNEAKALKVVISALGLLVGLSWEKAFDFALKEVVLREVSDESGYYYTFERLGTTLLMDLLVGPAWAFFILPKSDPDLHDKGGAEVLWGDNYEKDGDHAEEDSDGKTSDLPSSGDDEEKSLKHAE